MQRGTLEWHEAVETFSQPLKPYLLDDKMGVIQYRCNDNYVIIKNITRKNDLAVISITAIHRDFTVNWTSNRPLGKTATQEALQLRKFLETGVLSDEILSKIT